MQEQLEISVAERPPGAGRTLNRDQAIGSRRQIQLADPAWWYQERSCGAPPLRLPFRAPTYHASWACSCKRSAVQSRSAAQCHGSPIRRCPLPRQLVLAERRSAWVGTVAGVADRSDARWSGRFRLPVHDNPKTVGGWLDLSGRWPILELAEPLTPALYEVSRTTSPDGSILRQFEPADDALEPDGLVVHGLLRGGRSSLVTLVGARGVGRRYVISGPMSDPGDQRLRADYALLGGHEAGADAVFTKARLQLEHLDSWAQLRGVDAQVREDGSRITVNYEGQEAEAVDVPGHSARIVLDSTVTVPAPTVRGAAVTRLAKLHVEVPGGLTLDVLWRRFVSPLVVLMTLAVDKYCPPVAFHVYSEQEGSWLEVRRPELKEPAGDLLPVHEVFLTRMDLGLGHLAVWLDAATRLRPIPSLVAEIATAPDRTLVNQLLEMAIAAEGLHRRLQPNDRVMSLGQARQARRQARNAIDDPKVRERVNDALLHLEEPTYAERLSFITDLTSEAVPDATGQTIEWERRIKNVRNGFAHQTAPPSDGDNEEWQEYLVLLRTLRWVLTGALLLQTGIEPGRLSERLQQHEPYQFLLRQARQWLPDLYSALTQLPDGG